MRYFFTLYLILFTSAALIARDTDTTAYKEKLLLKKITIAGNKKTRRNIILREMSVQEGDSVSKEKLEEVTELNRKRIFNLSLFTDVQILVDTTQPDILNWDVIVKEQWYLIPELTFQLADRNFNVWWVEQNRDIRRANIGVTLKNRNFRGNLEEASVTAQIGYTQKFGLEYLRPYVDKRQRHGFGVKAFITRNEEWFVDTDSNKWEFAKTEGQYITGNGQLSLSYIFRPAYASRHLFELSYKAQTIKDTIVALNADYFQNGSTIQQFGEFIYRNDLNLVDNWNYPMQGYKSVFQAVLRVGFQGLGFQNQYYEEFGYFKKLSNKFYSSHIFRGRLSFPEKQPYTHVYAMGRGSEYVRGYEYYVIDGSHYGILRNNLKYELINYKLKIPIRYISTIPIRIYPKIYTDVGYARNKFPGNSTLNNRMLYSGGVGVDIVSVYDFKFRVEYTWNHLGEKGIFLHFTGE